MSIALALQIAGALWCWALCLLMLMGSEWARTLSLLGAAGPQMDDKLIGLHLAHRGYIYRMIDNQPTCA